MSRFKKTDDTWFRCRDAKDSAVQIVTIKLRAQLKEITRKYA